MAVKLPTGTVTFLFTDIEGSTRLLQRLGDGYRPVLEDHNELVRTAVDEAGGVTVRTEGDAFFAVFEDAPAAVAAAVSAQRALAGHNFPGGERPRVRMGVHTGIGSVGGDDYIGIDVHRAARIAAAGHGGQVLLSAATMRLAEQALAQGIAAVDLGDHVLKDLLAPERLFRLVIDGVPDNPAEPRSLSVSKGNLPSQLSSFVGRRAEMTEAESLLEQSRLLTLTGPGGTGKTRLSLELAHRVGRAFADGVFFVPLAGVSAPERVAGKILESFPDHVTESTVPTEDHLADYVGRRELLLVLDNFEHVIEAAPLIPHLLQASANSKIIVTSRIPLRIAGEQELPIPPLTTPPRGAATTAALLAGSDAAALFADRARSIRPSFGLDDRVAPVVAELVAQLDGLPLAIELAASRIRTLSPKAILDNLAQVMAGEGHRDLPARQRTMENTIAWSHDLLPESGRALLAAMSVFAGGAVFEDIEAVAGPELGTELLPALETLVEHSLVARFEIEDEPRFRMLEVVRQFGWRQLKERGLSAAIAARHSQTYARLVAAAEPNLTGPESGRWLDRLSVEHDNIRNAQQWAVDNGRLDMAYEMASSLWRFFHMRGLLYSARELLQKLLATEGASTGARARALEAAGGVAYWSGEMVEARAMYEEALCLLREVGDPGPVAWGQYNLAFAVAYLNDLEKALRLFGEAHDTFVELGDEAGQAAATWGIGNTWAEAGELGKARECIGHSIGAFERLGDDFGLGWALYTQGEVLVRLGELADARHHFERGMSLFDAGDVSAVVMFLAGFAALALARGDREGAARLAGAMTGLRDASGTDLVSLGISTATQIDPESLGFLEGDLADVYVQARAMSPAEAIALALGENPHPSSK